MNTPILNEIDRMKKKKYTNFHMPGHKGLNSLIDWSEYIPFGDLTEVGNLDNLQAPVGIIKESQEFASKIFKSKETIYSINGTTGGIYIGLGGLTNPGDTVLVQRNSHKSIYNSCILNRLNIEYLYPKIENNILTTINPEDIEKKLITNPDIKVVILTSPNYYGIVQNIGEISKIVRKYNRYLMVDEAHGSHFVFSDRLPKSSLEYNADIVIQSTHKTLPSFTQSSMVHIGSDRVDINRIREFSNLYQSTSPSYLLMLSLEIATNYMANEGRIKLNENIDIIEKYIKELENIEGLHIYNNDNKDITKILFSIDGYTGKELEELLYVENIFLEMSDLHYGLALSTVMNRRVDFEILFNKLKDIATNRDKYKIAKNFHIDNIHTMEESIYPIYKAFYMNSELVELDFSVNKISKSYITPYPPGVPLLVPGERITSDILKDIKNKKKLGFYILGLVGNDKNYIEVIE